MYMNQIETQYGIKVDALEFRSLKDFYDYICNTPINAAFRWKIHKSVDVSEYRTKFTGTRDFDEATTLFKDGYKEGAERLSNILKAEEAKVKPTYARRTAYDVQGYMPCVPLYLNGIPNNMITTKNVKIKQNVVIINKDISYSARVSKDEIIDESVKAFRIIRKLESQGYRCELNIVCGSYSYRRGFACRIRIKGADEKLNISKAAFPLIHPSMLRRLMFRFIEVYPHITGGFTSNYGTPISLDIFKQLYNGTFLPKIIQMDIDKLRKVEDIY